MGPGGADSKTNVLFTSVGRRVELVRAFRRAYERLGLDGRLIGVDIDPLAPALQCVDAAYIVPPVTDAEYVPALVDVCRRESADLLFPLIDPDIPVLAGARAALEATGCRLAVVSAAAAEIVTDKALTAEFFVRVGLRTARSWLPEQLDVPRLQYPLFIKPRRGSAGRYAFKVRSEDELRLFLAHVPGPIVQEYLSGAEVTSDVVCGLDGETLAVVSRERIEVRWGEVAKGVTVHDERIVEGCRRIARALPAVGPITVQCVMDRGEPCFTEINARLGGGVPLAIAAGADVPALLLAHAAGLPIDPEASRYRDGVYLTRFDDSFFLTAEDRARLGARRVGPDPR